MDFQKRQLHPQLMTVPGIYHITTSRGNTLANLVKLGWCLIVVLSFMVQTLSKELLPGPELTSQLVGIFTRFRIEEMVFMADIQAIFHQVHIPEKERNFLWYLWWEDVNL